MSSAKRWAIPAWAWDRSASTGNALQNEEQRKTLETAIDVAHLYGTNMVSTFAGALEGESVEAAIPRFKEVFGELTRRAEDRGVKLVIENCPMGGTWDHCTCNIGFNPKAWEMMFDAVPSDALGLEWEPAHQMGQLIEPVAHCANGPTRSIICTAKTPLSIGTLCAATASTPTNRLPICACPVSAT